MTAVASAVGATPVKPLSSKEVAANAPTKDKLSLVVGTLNDAAVVAKLVSDKFRAAYPWRRDNADRVTVAEYNEQISVNENKWFLLQQTNQTTKITKTVAALFYKEVAMGRGSIEIFARRVDVDKGLGAELLKRVEAEVHAKSISLWCVENPNGTDNEPPKLVDYYKGQGYMRTGKQEKFDNAFLKPEYHDKIRICQMLKNLAH